MASATSRLALSSKLLGVSVLLTPPDKRWDPKSYTAKGATVRGPAHPIAIMDATIRKFFILFFPRWHKSVFSWPGRRRRSSEQQAPGLLFQLQKNPIHAP